jgi:hypothetical protein
VSPNAFASPASSILTGRSLGRVQDRAAQASVALWAFLHGAVASEAAQVFGESKPASGLEFGLDAWLMAVSTRGERD